MNIIPRQTSHHAPGHSSPALTLTGEQRKILSLPLRQPVLLRGVAGSGKTTLAIMRAQFLLLADEDMFRETNIHVFAYTKSLSRFMRSLLADTPNTHAKRVSVSTFHEWTWAFLNKTGFWQTHEVPDSRRIVQIILDKLNKQRQTYPEKALLRKAVTFFADEISWMKGQGLRKKQAYLEIKRTGRGTTDRVTAADREIIWSIYFAYCKYMKESGWVDYDDYAIHALSVIAADPDFKPPFSHIVIDEAQDFSAAQIRLMTSLVSRETNSITLIADAAQRIYKSGFTWSSVGIDVRGASRSVELKHNYRNTREIAAAALALLENDPQQEEFTPQVIPERTGKRPELLTGDNASQFRWIIEKIRATDLTRESLVLLHRTVGGGTAIYKELLKHSIRPLNIKDEDTCGPMISGLYYCTMSSIKGLEFDHVVLSGLNDNIFPQPSGLAEEDNDLHLCTERRLLYTCMTRAKQTLTLISSGKPCRFLAEIPASKIESRSLHDQ